MAWLEGNVNADEMHNGALYEDSESQCDTGRFAYTLFFVRF